METDTWLWILAWFLCAIFLGTGLLKLTTSRERMVRAGMAWAGDLGERTLRLLGAVEVAGAVCLVLPPLLGHAPALVPVGAGVLAAAAAVQTTIHARRGELLPDALRTLALVVLCVLLAVYRLGPQPF